MSLKLITFIYIHTQLVDTFWSCKSLDRFVSRSFFFSITFKDMGLSLVISVREEEV